MQARLAIVTFPELGAEPAAMIAAARARYDPLARVLPPHVTIVFPFEPPPAEGWLVKQLQAVAVDLPSFTIEFSGVSAQPDNYLFLDMSRGADHLVALHDRLYADCLAPHRSAQHIYQPHLTVGRLSDRKDVGAARDAVEQAVALPMQGTVRSLSICCILDEACDVVFTVRLAR